MLYSKEKVYQQIESDAKLNEFSRCIAFGSRVTGDHRPDSDLDVYIEVGKPFSFDVIGQVESIKESIADRFGLVVHTTVGDFSTLTDSLREAIFERGELIYDAARTR